VDTSNSSIDKYYVTKVSVAAQFLTNFFKKKTKKNENPKKHILDIFASFLAFLALSQKNLNFKSMLNVFDF
jgi:hypothetical protein